MTPPPIHFIPKRANRLLDLLPDMHRLWCRAVGGKRYVLSLEWSGGWLHPSPSSNWMKNALVCRLRQHVFDGTEVGFASGGDKVDLHCARCFYFHRRLPSKDVFFVQHLREAVERVEENVPEEDKLQWDGVVCKDPETREGE